MGQKMKLEQKDDKKKIVMRMILVGILSGIASVITAMVVTGHLWQVACFRQNLIHLINVRAWTCLYRAYLLFFAYFFIGLHFILPIKKMYQWMFNRRWFLGILLLLFLTLNRFHGDSITYYYNVIQPGMGDASSMPIFSQMREIRSDEFIVNTPSVLASGYGEEPYGKYNEIMRGTDTLSIVTGVYAGYATLAFAPWEYTYLFLPTEYAFSFCWYAPLILGFLMSIEIFYIITKKNKLLSVAGAFLVIFSSFYLWWGFSPYMISAPGTIVCIYYFLNKDKIWKKILCGIGIALCFSNFVVSLYPAWQVPLGYMFLAIGIWLLHDNWDKIKKLELKEWLILAGCILFMVSLVLSYFYTASEYINAIANTVYPGKRIDTGSFNLGKLFYYVQSPFYAYQELTNPSEAGVFFSLFPIPTIMAAYCWVKEKKKDWLTAGLLLAQLPMIIYVSIGFSEVLAKLTLFSNSTTGRTVDIIGLIQVYFITIILSRYENAKKLPIVVATVFAVITAGIGIYVSNHDFPNYLNRVQILVMFVVVTCVCVGLMINLNKKKKNILLLGFICISIVTGIYIRPVMKGLAAIYSKPVAHEIEKICETDKNAKWLTYGGGHVLSAYSVACGASTVNSVNMYPNLELWDKLDSDNKYESVYNRYAHINVTFTDKDTSFEEIQGDFIQINLSYKDIEETKATYLLVMGELNVDTDNGYVGFEKVYEENGTAIYHLLYY